jgi:hypothetical protein
MSHSCEPPGFGEEGRIVSLPMKTGRASQMSWQVLLVILAGWINKHQRDVIEFLLVENRILREEIGKKRILLNDFQRRRSAIKG